MLRYFDYLPVFINGGIVLSSLIKKKGLAKSNVKETKSSMFALNSTIF